MALKPKGWNCPSAGEISGFCPDTGHHRQTCRECRGVWQTSICIVLRIYLEVELVAQSAGVCSALVDNVKQF